MAEATEEVVEDADVVTDVVKLLTRKVVAVELHLQGNNDLGNRLAYYTVAIGMAERNRN